MKNLVFVALALGLWAGGCKPKCGPDRITPEGRVQSALSFRLVDRNTGQRYFPLFATGDGFSITDAKGTVYEVGFGSSGIFDLNDFLFKNPEDLAGLDTSAEKVFYLRLSATDTDTIRYVYRLGPERWCGELRVTYQQVWFNGRLMTAADLDEYLVYKFPK
jgi:hypothetical protein